MDGLTLLAIIVAGLALLGVAAQTIGVDSRLESSDPHSPAHPVGLS